MNPVASLNPVICRRERERERSLCSSQCEQCVAFSTRSEKPNLASLFHIVLIDSLAMTSVCLCMGCPTHGGTFSLRWFLQVRREMPACCQPASQPSHRNQKIERRTASRNSVYVTHGVHGLSCMSCLVVGRAGCGKCIRETPRYIGRCSAVPKPNGESQFRFTSC